VSVALDFLDLGIQLIDPSVLEGVEVGFAPPLSFADGREAEKVLSGVSIDVTFRELRSLLSLVDGVRRELDSTTEEFDVPLDETRPPVALATLVVDMIG